MNYFIFPLLFYCVRASFSQEKHTDSTISKSYSSQSLSSSKKRVLVISNEKNEGSNIFKVIEPEDVFNVDSMDDQDPREQRTGNSNLEDSTLDGTIPHLKGIVQQPEEIIQQVGEIIQQAGEMIQQAGEMIQQREKANRWDDDTTQRDDATIQNYGEIQMRSDVTTKIPNPNQKQLKSNLSNSELNIADAEFEALSGDEDLELVKSHEQVASNQDIRKTEEPDSLFNMEIEIIPIEQLMGETLNVNVPSNQPDTLVEDPEEEEFRRLSQKYGLGDIFRPVTHVFTSSTNKMLNDEIDSDIFESMSDEIVEDTIVNQSIVHDNGTPDNQLSTVETIKIIPFVASSINDELEERKDAEISMDNKLCMNDGLSVIDELPMVDEPSRADEDIKNPLLEIPMGENVVEPPNTIEMQAQNPVNSNNVPKGVKVMNVLLKKVRMPLAAYIVIAAISFMVGTQFGNCRI